MNGNELSTVWAPRMLSVLRIMAALLFIEHGTQKLFGFPGLATARTAFALAHGRRRHCSRPSAACSCSSACSPGRSPSSSRA